MMIIEKGSKLAQYLLETLCAHRLIHRLTQQFLNSPDLFPVYLQRHSLHTRLKDMAPFARGTSSALSANIV